MFRGKGRKTRLGVDWQLQTRDSQRKTKKTFNFNTTNPNRVILDVYRFDCYAYDQNCHKILFRFSTLKTICYCQIRWQLRM